MKYGEDEVKRERGVEQFVGQMFRCPKREQAEHGESGDRLSDGNFFVEPCERGDSEVNQENKAEQQQGPLRERREREEKRGERQRDGGKREIAAGEPPVRLRAALGEPVRRAPQRVEAEQHGERDEDFAALKIFFVLEEFVRPADLHECRAQRRERREKIPAAV